MSSNLQVKRLIEEIQENSHKKVIVYALDGCPACEEFKSKIDKIGLVFENIGMDGNDVMWKMLSEKGGSDFVPQVEVEGYLIKEEEYETVNELVSKTLSRLLERKIIIK
jgi:glutaredoxin